MPDFSTVTLKPMTGVFDSLSSKDEISFGNFRLVKNATTRSTRNRQRGGGWRKLFSDELPYSNADLHDQLTDRQFFYDIYTDHAMGGGDLAGYNYPYFWPSSSNPAFSVFPPAAGPYCPVYIGDHPSGSYNGCPIFYPSVGYPYEFVPGFVSTAAARAHWKMDSIAASTPDLFGGLDLDFFGPTVVPGLLGNSLLFSPGDHVGPNFYAAFQVGDIKFGFTGFIHRTGALGANKAVLDSWAVAGNRAYRLYLDSFEQLVFEVSSNGTASTTVTNTTVIPLNEWAFFACWHDPVADTINLKVNDGATISVSYSGGVFAGTGDFAVGYDGETTNALLSARIDSLTYWKNGFPTEDELLGIYNAALGLDYPFSSQACNTGEPFYYVHSFVYASCPTVFPSVIVPGYPYGSRTPFYDPVFGYDYTYCGDDLHNRSGCREAVTMLNEIVTEAGRKLIASTMSRVYELNQSSGNWRILVDGLGNAGYTVDQCTCNRVRGVSDTMGGYLLYTNNFDQPMSYFVGEDPASCSLNSLQVITDLDALGITRAGGVVTWKGFAIWFDLTETGSRFGGDVMWSDLEDPNSYIESDTSFAGRSTIAVGETLLAAEELGNWLIFYGDKGSIIRCTLVGGEDVFNFERIYKGGNGLKYKFSLFSTGDMHGWLGESDIYFLTQFDTRPIAISWVTKAAGMIFKGIVEEDAVYDSINKDACELVTGGYSEEKHEAWLSWPTGDSICPTVTLRMNMKFNAADFVDHGFTAFLTYRKDTRPTVGQWIEDMGICPRGSWVGTGMKDGDVCGVGEPVANPPLYIRNPTEDPDLPVHEDSLCARLDGVSVDDFCQDCTSPTTFITASAVDFTLKQQEDEILYREMLGGNIEAYDAYSCHGEFYHFLGYDTVIQEGSEAYRSDDEKMIKRIQLEAEPWQQASPSPLECELAYGNQSDCMTWVAARTLDFECQTAKTPAQHAADNTRPDDVFNFPVWRRGQYLSARFRISGIGGGGTFSAIHKQILGWGQPESP